MQPHLSSTFVVVLEYCGGIRTDSLVAALREWNPEDTINVLDNGSTRNVCKSVTRWNKMNSNIGGGIRDCIALANASGAKFLLFIANDVQFVRPLRVAHFRRMAESDANIVHISASVTPGSHQAKHFPWMVDTGTGSDRVVWHADILVSLLNIEFIHSFGGFPESKGGWGYSWELAFHALRRGRRILIAEQCVVHHDSIPQEGTDIQEIRAAKDREMLEVYKARYGNIPWINFRKQLVERSSSLESR